MRSFLSVLFMVLGSMALCLGIDFALYGILFITIGIYIEVLRPEDDE